MESVYHLRDVQKTELLILKDVRDLCEKHHLRYALYCGTLLGCVRHQGFIPWDDDADLLMPLADYRRFCRLAQEELSDRYTFHDYHSGRMSVTCWLKLYRKGTAYYSPYEENCGHDKGISLDIYPLIGAYDGWLGQMQTQAILLQQAMVKKDFRIATSYRTVVHHEKMLRILDRLPDGFRCGVASLIEKLFWADPEKHELCGTVDSARFGGKYHYRDWNSLIEGQFEDGKFAIPAEYDRFLTKMYGFYMKLPPENMRISHHGADAVIRIDEETAKAAGIST